jgi:hypothetical protein
MSVWVDIQLFVVRFFIFIITRVFVFRFRLDDFIRRFEFILVIFVLFIIIPFFLPIILPMLLFAALLVSGRALGAFLY